jgi:hypothetical protein
MSQFIKLKNNATGKSSLFNVDDISSVIGSDGDTIVTMRSGEEIPVAEGIQAISSRLTEVGAMLA